MPSHTYGYAWRDGVMAMPVCGVWQVRTQLARHPLINQRGGVRTAIHAPRYLAGWLAGWLAACLAGCLAGWQAS